MRYEGLFLLSAILLSAVLQRFCGAPGLACFWRLINKWRQGVQALRGTLKIRVHVLCTLEIESQSLIFALSFLV